MPQVGEPLRKSNRTAQPSSGASEGKDEIKRPVGEAGAVRRSGARSLGVRLAAGTICKSRTETRQREYPGRQETRTRSDTVRVCYRQFPCSRNPPRWRRSDGQGWQEPQRNVGTNSNVNTGEPFRPNILIQNDEVAPALTLYGISRSALCCARRFKRAPAGNTPFNAGHATTSTLLLETSVL
jgi:hypothetical protein